MDNPKIIVVGDKTNNNLMQSIHEITANIIYIYLDSTDDADISLTQLEHDDIMASSIFMGATHVVFLASNDMEDDGRQVNNDAILLKHVLTLKRILAHYHIAEDFTLFIELYSDIKLHNIANLNIDYIINTKSFIQFIMSEALVNNTITWQFFTSLCQKNHYKLNRIMFKDHPYCAQCQGIYPSFKQIYIYFLGHYGQQILCISPNRNMDAPLKRLIIYPTDIEYFSSYHLTDNDIILLNM